jgi:hypothetical protein
MVVIRNQLNNRRQVDRVRAWVLENLPGLNTRALAGELPYWDLASLLNSYVLRDLPRPGALAHPEAMQILMLLSFVGCSVERHARQQSVQREPQPGPPPLEGMAPGKGLKALLVNRGTRFMNYFIQVADQVSHPHGFSVRTLVDHNGPGVVVRHPTRGEVIHTSEAAFEDGRFLTFSGRRAEVEFMVAVKTASALQSAASGYIESLVRLEIALDSPRAIEAVLTALHLMQAAAARLNNFTRHVDLDLDLIPRTFWHELCAWPADPALDPRAAAGQAALHGEVMLFDQLEASPRFDRLLEQACGARLPAQREPLDAAMARPSLETRLRRQAPGGMQSGEAAGLARQYPWLIAYLRLYNAQHDLSCAFDDLESRYITHAGRGAAGQMTPHDRTCHPHPLSHLNDVPGMDQLAYLSRFGYRDLAEGHLLSLAGLIAGPQRQPAWVERSQRARLMSQP